MVAHRGSQQTLLAIAEVTPGVTPATPVMKEIPITNFSRRSSKGVLRSEQIRAHPYVDKMLEGLNTHEIGIDWELQPAVHDFLLETVFGASITTKALAYADVLKTLSTESRSGGTSGLFDHFLGLYLNRITFTAAASDTAPVKVSTTGMALTGTLDDATTVASSVTAAANPDPYVFADATLNLLATPTSVVSGNFTIERAVDPLNVWGQRTAREYVPGAVTASGTSTIPYDDATQSTVFEAFTDVPQVYKFAAKGGGTFRQFTFPKTKFVSFGRQIQDRGVILQEINWEAYYDSTSGTICTMLTE